MRSIARSLVIAAAGCVAIATVTFILESSLANAGEPCPGAVRFDVDASSSDIDPGWTGMAHDNHYVGLTLTMAIGSCAGTEQPTCGTCSLSGPVANPGGATFNNHRCIDKTWLTCTTNGDCVSQGAAGPCQIMFGPPLPYTAGGVAVCVVNEITGAGSGSIGVESGDVTMNLPYKATIFSAGDLSHPCPRCIAGACNGGARHGFSCTVNGSAGTFGDVSFDCPPLAGAAVGLLVPSGLTLSTATLTKTLTIGSPDCRGGLPGKKCLCDTCNNGPFPGTPCATSADCPDPPGPIGPICGGKRCGTGVNAGAACNLGSECPGSACTVPGLATEQNQCDDRNCTPNPSDTDSSNEGVCAVGPFDVHCAIETFRGCLADSDCPLAGDTCSAGDFRECFTDNGTIGGSISAAGVADPPSGNEAAPTLVALTCVPPTTSSGVNVVGFPGPGRLTLPSLLTLADETASGTVPIGGGTVTTDTEADGATPSDPLETSVSSPNAGQIILDEQATAGAPPGGYTFLGKQVHVTAPSASPASPLVITFRIDASRIPLGEDQNSITIFKNGTAVGPCAGAGATPDPCVASRVLLGDGDVEITIRTSTASLWQFATGSVCQPSPDFGCATPDVPQKALLLLKDKADDTKDLLVWKWLKGTAGYADFGAPGSTTSFNFCVYDNNGLVSAGTVPAIGPWTGNTSGFKYKDKTGASSGFTQLLLKSNANPSKAKIVLKGKGVGLDMPGTGGLISPVRAELHRSDAPTCWAANYSAPFIKQDAEQFKDKAD